jgi:hypothetical protein
MHTAHMPVELIWPCKRLVALATRVRPRARVCSHVLREVRRLRELLVAVCTLERLIARVCSLVDRKRACDGERLVASGKVALVRFFE